MHRRNGSTGRIEAFEHQGFDVEAVQRTLEEHGIASGGRGTRPESPRPLQHWLTMRTPNRGGAPEGTPELYLAIRIAYGSKFKM